MRNEDASGRGVFEGEKYTSYPDKGSIASEKQLIKMLATEFADYGAQVRREALEAAAQPAQQVDRKSCSLCGTVRTWLNREGTLRGACTFLDCKDPLFDYRREHPDKDSRQ